MDDRILEILKKHSEQLSRIENGLNLSKAVLNLEEVCNYTGLSKSHIYKLTCTSRIPFYKQGKHLFFDRVEVENWLKENKHITMDEIDRQAATYVTFHRKG